MRPSYFALIFPVGLFRNTANVILSLVLSWAGSSTLVWAQGQVDLSGDGPLLVYQVTHEAIKEDAILKIEIFSDGHASLHYPFYMKHSGDYSVTLSQGEFQRLINTLDTPAIVSFDKNEVASKKKTQDAEAGVFTYVSDSTYSSFEIGRSDGHGKSKQQISWSHLQHDAKNYPGIQAIASLAQVETILRDLINHPGLQGDVK
ncbi:MAG: hypothetical protein ACU84H_11545 [Gammaproteobacteria bacterium]